MIRLVKQHKSMFKPSMGITFNKFKMYEGELKITIFCEFVIATHIGNL